MSNTDKAPKGDAPAAGSSSSQPSPAQGLAPPQGQSYPPPGQGYPPPGQSYPPPGQGYPPPGQGHPPPGQGYPPPGQGYPPPGQGHPPPGSQYPPPGYYPPPGGSQHSLYPPPQGYYPPPGGSQTSMYPPPQGYPPQGYPGQSAPPGQFPPPQDPYDKRMETAPGQMESGQGTQGSSTNLQKGGSSKDINDAKKSKETGKRTGGGVVVGGIIGGTIGLLGGPAGVAFGAAAGAAIGGAAGHRSGKRYDERDLARNAAKLSAEAGKAEFVDNAPNIFDTPTPGPLSFELILGSDRQNGCVINQFGQELFKFSPLGYKVQFKDANGNCPFALMTKTAKKYNDIKIMKTMQGAPVLKYKGTSELTSAAKVSDMKKNVLVRLQTMQKEMQVWILNYDHTVKFGAITFTNNKQKLLLDILGGTDVHLLMSIAACYLLDVNHGGKISFDQK